MQVTVERLDAIDEESKTEIVHAKFVVGADGMSWSRPTSPGLAPIFSL
jgi:phenol 2-monooxygenase